MGTDIKDLFVRMLSSFSIYFFSFPPPPCGNPLTAQKHVLKHSGIADLLIGHFCKSHKILAPNLKVDYYIAVPTT